MFLYEKLDTLREYGNISELTSYIAKNLNSVFGLRPYQVLFHMATGSGKTLIMAGLMLYLYKQCYRNFLFFVNLTNILDKTRENFLNAESAKYLFANDINIGGESIRINAVENFQASAANAINICFETTQELHTKMFAPRENVMTFNDFEDKKIILILD